MRLHLKPIEEQVIVITGASSGIGLATARDAARRGARLVLVSRNDEALKTIAEEINRRGGRAVAVTGDVANPDDMERAARTAIDSYGRIDTWVNNAGVAIYGRIEDVPIDDQRRLFETNYWGIVNGSIVAAKHLRRRGGAIVNVGSVLSDRAMMLQGPYSASKHAVKAFTDALRMELEADGAPISVSLIKPSAIDTLYAEHARTYLDAPGVTNPPPSYDPHLVAKAILHAAEYGRRDLYIGFGGYSISLMGRLFPRLMDFVMESTASYLQTSDHPGRQARRDNLYEPREDRAEHSSLPGSARKSSLFLESQLHPMSTFALLAGLGLGLAAVQFLRSGAGGRRSVAMPSRPRSVATRRAGNGQDQPSVGPGQYPHRSRLAAERRPSAH